ncbi:unnamed protein product, partial [Meganyctiphanes norvegica]
MAWSRPPIQVLLSGGVGYLLLMVALTLLAQAYGEELGDGPALQRDKKQYDPNFNPQSNLSDFPSSTGDFLRKITRSGWEAVIKIHENRVLPNTPIEFRKMQKANTIIEPTFSRFPQVEAFSFKGSEEAPLIQDSPGHAFDTRGFSQRSEEEDRERLAEPKGCGGTFTDLGGILNSPDYPFNYPNNMHCVYHISVDPAYTIGLDCSDFSIQPGDKQCENDYFGISYGGKVDPENMDKYCGDKAVALISTTNNLTIVFSSNTDYRYRGFLCRYRALNPDGTGIQPTVNVVEKHYELCGNSDTGNSGWAGLCGVSHAYNRIVGGLVTEQHAFPWMVAVLKECGKNLDHYCHICGGTVIHTQWILTGAHCVISVPVERLGLLLGDHNLYTLTPSQKFFRVEASYVHPDFNVPSPLNNDVALLKLPQEMSFSSYIAPVCLPPRTTVDFLNLLPRVYDKEDETTTTWVYGSSTPSSTFGSRRRERRQAATAAADTTTATTEVPLGQQLIHRHVTGRNISVYGWGTINDDGDVAQQLRQVTVEVLDNEVCNYYYGVMTDTMMCTSGEDGHGPCQGDSGSPAQLKTVDGRWLQVGVLAFGAAYGCEVGYPSGNVMLPFYMDWIEFVTGFNFQEYYS